MDDSSMSAREQLASIRSDIRDLQAILRVHENRWQRIIGFLLVVTFIGFAGFAAILGLLWAVFQAVT